MNILLKVALICFVLTVVNYVLTRVMTDSMTASEEADYIWNDTMPKRLMFFVICFALSFTAMCISLIGALIMM